VIVAENHLDALARLELDRDDFLGKAAVGPGAIGELLAAQRIFVLFGA